MQDYVIGCFFTLCTQDICKPASFYFSSDQSLFGANLSSWLVSHSYARLLMWSLPWSPWASWSSQGKEPEEVKKQTKVGERQRSQRGVKYYQRNRSEEKSVDIDETAGMYKRKVKPPGGAKRAAGGMQQSGGAELDDGWQVVQEEELQVISTCKCKGRNSNMAFQKVFLCK